MKIKLINPKDGKYLGNDDTFVETSDDARIFDSLLAADSYAAYVQHVYGVVLFTVSYIQ